MGKLKNGILYICIALVGIVYRRLIFLDSGWIEIKSSVFESESIVDNYIFTVT